jgi:hypothetical protein
MKASLFIAVIGAGLASVGFAPASEALTNVPRLQTPNTKGSAPVAAIAMPKDLAEAKVESAQANWHWSTRQKRNAHYWRQRTYWRRYK